MGISSAGIFFYGLIWKDNERPWREPSSEELQKVAQERNVAVMDLGEVDWEDLYEMRSGKKLKDCPVTTNIHCSFEYAMNFVAIRDTLLRADRGHPQLVNVLTVKSEWDGQLRDFCKVMGIDWQDPAWWLTSLYG